MFSVGLIFVRSDFRSKYVIQKRGFVQFYFIVQRIQKDIDILPHINYYLGIHIF